MIDIENEVFTRVKTALDNTFAEIYITSPYNRIEETFPHVTIEQSDSYTPREYETNSDEEKIATFTFEINVYSNKMQGKKLECQQIMNVIDKTLRKMNFRRTTRQTVPNLEDATIYRMLARYIVNSDGEGFYRN